MDTRPPKDAVGIHKAVSVFWGLFPKASVPHGKAAVGRLQHWSGMQRIVSQLDLGY